MHSQGRALNSIMINQLGADIDHYTLREAEFSTNCIIGFNFGDGHLHDPRFIESIQRRCGFEPGEFLVVWIESQPVHKPYLRYQVIDAAWVSSNGAPTASTTPSPSSRGCRTVPSRSTWSGGSMATSGCGTPR